MAALSRRQLLRASAAGVFVSGATASGGPLSGVLVPGLGRVADSQTTLPPDAVQFRDEIEPLVRFIEETPRDSLMEQMGARVRSGLPYKDVLAALFLAGIRNIQPRPAVGFKFHAVLVVNSAHVASLESPSADRWLPIFWALDEFKSSQTRDVSEGNWTMSAVAQSKIPSPENTVSMFETAMRQWDESAADVSAAAVSRYLGATQTLDLFAKFAARDFRSIGHKAIYLANSWRTLQTIGWEYSEPVLRSLAYAMLNHNGEPNPAESDLGPDRSWKLVQKSAAEIRNGWQHGRSDSGAVTELLQLFRSGTPDEAIQLAARQLNEGISPQTIYDAIHVGSAELLMRQSGIVALHAMTTTNAIRFLFDNTGNDLTRRELLLQNVAFLPQFREAMVARGTVGNVRIDELTAKETSTNSEQAMQEIFADVRVNAEAAAGRMFGWLERGDGARELIHTARRLIFLKGNDSHDYKFSTAVMEDFYKISGDWRNRFLASGAYQLRSLSDPDNGLIDRIRKSVG
ncbi:MAG: hypothetical protein JNL58_21455 [Planctomyces sp.]|nr:hypothetical protein [Planctomyces sp.]